MLYLISLLLISCGVISNIEAQSADCPSCTSQLYNELVNQIQQTSLKLDNCATRLGSIDSVKPIYDSFSEALRVLSLTLLTSKKLYVKGIPGDTGFTGNFGNTGFTGPVGLGPKGDTGQVGATGNTGAQGIIGWSGLQGATGDTGASGRRTKRAVSTLLDKFSALLNSCPGPIANIIKAYITILDGIQSNKNYQVCNATDYLASSYPGLQVLKTDVSTAYINLLTDVRAYKLFQGARGVQGPSGPRGPIGQPGKDGVLKGYTGDTGYTGYDGNTGYSGFTGPKGKKGSPGLSG